MLSELGGEERRETFTEYLLYASTDPALRQTSGGVISLLHPVRERYFPYLTHQEIASKRG